MAAAPPCQHNTILLLLLLCTGSLIQPIKGFCGCAERFLSRSDLSNDTTRPFFGNNQYGELLVFNSARFHCNDMLRTIYYNGQMEDCRTNCTNYDSIQSDNSPPAIQLWRENETDFAMISTRDLEEDSTSMDLKWAVKDNDVIALWIPSSCSCTGKIFRVGYVYAREGSRVYLVEGYTESFPVMDYTLEHRPMPMIAVETDEDFSAICIIGVPAGALISLIGVLFTCVGIYWSISAYNKKIAQRGKLVISHPADDEEETEMVNGAITSDEIATNQYQEESFGNNGNAAHISARPLPPLPTDIDSADFEETRSLTNSPPPQYSGRHSYGNVTHSMSNPDLHNPHQYGNIDDSKRFTSLERRPQAKPRESVSSAHQQPVSYPPQQQQRPLSANYPQQLPQQQQRALSAQQPQQQFNYPQTQTMPVNTQLQKQRSLDYPQQGNPQYPATPPTMAADPQTSPPIVHNTTPLSAVGSPGSIEQTDDPQNNDIQQIPEQSYDRHSEYEVSDDEDSEPGEVADEYMNIQSINMETDNMESDAVYY